MCFYCLLQFFIVIIVTWMEPLGCLVPWIICIIEMENILFRAGSICVREVVKQWTICYFIVVACNLLSFSFLHHQCPFWLCPSPWLTSSWLHGIVNLVEGGGLVAWRTIAPSLMWCVWMETIKRVFEGKERSVGQIKSGFLRMLFQWVWCNCLLVFQALL